MMWTDPVVNEIHQIRQQLLADAGGDFHIFMEKIRSEQTKSGRAVIESPLSHEAGDGSVARPAQH